MNDKKLFILGIDNNPKVWYNEGGGTARPPAFRDFSRKNFCAFCLLTKLLGYDIMEISARLGVGGPASPTFYYSISKRALSIVKLNKKVAPNWGNFFTI